MLSIISTILLKMINITLCWNIVAKGIFNIIELIMVSSRNYSGRQGERFCKNLAFAVIRALELIHKKGIAHRDLKLSNILITD